MAKGSVWQKETATGKVWYMRVQLPRGVDGTRHSKTRRCPAHVSSEAQARKAAMAWQLEVDRSGWTDPNRQSLAAYLDQYLTRREQYANAERTSLMKYRAQARVIGRYLGTTHIDRLTAEQVQQMLDAMIAAGRASYTVHQYHMFLRKVLADAVKAGHILYNVTDRVTPPPARSKPGNAFTRAEVLRFLELARADDLWPIWLFILTTGVRKGEAIGLRWQDLDLPRRRAIIRQAVKRVGTTYTGPPKGGNVRRVPISDDLAVALAMHRDAQRIHSAAEPAWHDRDLVFAARFGGPLSAKILNVRLTQLCAEAGTVRLTVHDLRRTYSTLLNEAGENPRTVQAILGHANIEQTLSTYTLATDTMVDAAGERMGRLLHPDS